MGRDVFAEARRTVPVSAVVAIAGIKLYREGADMRGECPLCGASSKKSHGGAFKVRGGDTRWKCFSCDDRGGDVIELAHRLPGDLAGATLRETALRLLNEPPALQDPDWQAKSAQREDIHSRRIRFRQELAISLWKEGRSAAGTLVEAYYRTRGWHGAVLANALKMLRFHPRALHSFDSNNQPVYAPASIGLIMTPWGPTGGVQATYLRPDGSGKSHLTPSRKAWGPEKRADPDGILRPGGIWLAPPDGPGQLIVGEGIETAGSAGVLLGAPCRPVSTLGLKNLQGGWLTDDKGCIDLTDLTPNPRLPAFTWRSPPESPWPGPLICLDMDMETVRVKTRTADGGVTEVELNAARRAAVCATLAGAAWLKAGATGVGFATPPPDMDMGDQLLASQRGLCSPKIRVTTLESAPGRNPVAPSCK